MAPKLKLKKMGNPWDKEEALRQRASGEAKFRKSSTKAGFRAGKRSAQSASAKAQLKPMRDWDKEEALRQRQSGEAKSRKSSISTGMVKTGKKGGKYVVGKGGAKIYIKK